MTLEDMERQLRELQDLNEIKDVTYRSWYAADTKDREMARDVFAPGKIQLVFENCPEFHDRDSFLEFYFSVVLDPAFQQSHFGSSPRIAFVSGDHAVGNWRVNHVAFNYTSRTLMRGTGEFDNEYVRIDGAWKIWKSTFKRQSLLVEHIAADGAVTVPELKDVSPDASAPVSSTEGPPTDAGRFVPKVR